MMRPPCRGTTAAARASARVPGHQLGRPLKSFWNHYAPNSSRCLHSRGCARGRVGAGATVPHGTAQGALAAAAKENRWARWASPCILLVWSGGSCRSDQVDHVLGHGIQKRMQPSPHHCRYPEKAHRTGLLCQPHHLFSLPFTKSFSPARVFLQTTG